MRRKRKATTLFLTGILLLLCSVVFAQPGGGGDPGPGKPVPIPGASLLLAAGGALGLRALLKRAKK
jgi:hypothetical protein